MELTINELYEHAHELKDLSEEDREIALIGYIGAILNEPDHGKALPRLIRNGGLTPSDMALLCDTARLFWRIGACDPASVSDQQTIELNLNAQPKCRQERYRQLKGMLGKAEPNRVLRLRKFLNYEIWSLGTGRGFSCDWGDISGAPLGFDAGVTLGIGPEDSRIGITVGFSAPRARNGFKARAGRSKG